MRGSIHPPILKSRKRSILPDTSAKEAPDDEARGQSSVEPEILLVICSVYGRLVLRQDDSGVLRKSNFLAVALLVEGQRDDD